MINTLFFCNSIPMVILLLRRMIEVDTMVPGTVTNPRAGIYAHSSLTLKGEKWIISRIRRGTWQTRLRCEKH